VGGRPDVWAICRRIDYIITLLLVLSPPAVRVVGLAAHLFLLVLVAIPVQPSANVTASCNPLHGFPLAIDALRTVDRALDSGTILDALHIGTIDTDILFLSRLLTAVIGPFAVRILLAELSKLARFHITEFGSAVLSVHHRKKHKESGDNHN